MSAATLADRLRQEADRETNPVRSRVLREGADEVERHVRELEARKALRDALAEVWSGADFTDTDAVIDQLDDRGYRVVRK